MKTFTPQPAPTFNCLTKPLPVRPSLGAGRNKFTRSIANKYGPLRRQQAIPYLTMILKTSNHAIAIHYRVSRNTIASKITQFVIRPHLNIAMAPLFPRNRIDYVGRNVLTNPIWDSPRSNAFFAASPVANVQPSLTSALLRTYPASLTMPRPGAVFVHRSWQDDVSRLHRLFTLVRPTADRAFSVQAVTTAIVQSILTKLPLSATISSAYATPTQSAPILLGFGNIGTRASIRPHHPQSALMGPVTSSALILPSYDPGPAPSPLQLRQHESRQTPASVFMIANIINRLSQPILHAVSRNLDRALRINQGAYSLSLSSRPEREPNGWMPGRFLHQFPTRVEMRRVQARQHLMPLLQTLQPTVPTLRVARFPNSHSRTFAFPSPLQKSSRQPSPWPRRENHIDGRGRQLLDIMSSPASAPVVHIKPAVREGREPFSAKSIMTRIPEAPASVIRAIATPFTIGITLSNGQRQTHIDSSTHFPIWPSRQRNAGVSQPHVHAVMRNRSVAADQLRYVRGHDELTLATSLSTPSARHLSPAYQAPPQMQLATSQAQTAQDVTQAFKDLEKRLADSAPKENTAPAPTLDMHQLTDQVYQEIERKLRIERERRGL